MAIARFADRAVEQRRHVLGVLLLDLEDVFYDSPRRRIVVAEPAEDLQIGFDCNSLGDEILTHHRQQVGPGDVFGMAAPGENLRIEIGLAAKPDDPLRHSVGVPLLLGSVCGEFRFDPLRVAASGHLPPLAMK